MSPQPQMPALIGKRTAFSIFAPLAILVAAALVTNLGGGVAKDANATNINITANVNSNKHFTTTCGVADPGAGTMNFGPGNLGSDVVDAESCAVVYGSNDDTELGIQGWDTVGGAASDTAGMAGFTAVGAGCTDLAPGTQNGRIGIRASASGGTNPNALAPFNCAADRYSAIPTAVTGICDVDAGTDSTCTIELGLDTGGVSSGSKSGQLRLTLT